MPRYNDKLRTRRVIAAIAARAAAAVALCVAAVLVVACSKAASAVPLRSDRPPSAATRVASASAPASTPAPAPPVVGRAVAETQPEPPTPESFCVVPAAAAQEVVQKNFGEAFRVLETAHFRVISDCAPRSHRLIAGSLEQFYGLVHPRFFKTEMKPVLVYLIESAEDFRALCRKQRHAGAANTYGFYLREERALYAHRLMDDGSLSGMGTMFHETVHAMVHADFPADAPDWFNEGFASLFEQGRILRGQWVYGNPNPWRETDYRVAFEAGDIASLTHYLTMSDREFRGPNQMLNYNTGRTVCVWLLRRGGDQLARFVDLTRRGASGVAAIEGATALGIKEIEVLWREHVRAVHFGGAWLDRAENAAGPEALAILAEATSKHGDYGSLRAEYAKRLRVAARPEEAQREAEAALKDPRIPNPEVAYEVLRWRHEASDLAKSGAAARAVVELQPWLEVIHPEAFATYAAALRAQGNPDEATRVEAELERQRRDARRGSGP